MSPLPARVVVGKFGTSSVTRREIERASEDVDT
jgi:bifunctional ADP-heptose synthase (sugar kinase/adenylyltransferase)